MSSKELRTKLKGNLKGEDEKKDAFLGLLEYVSGAYDAPEGYQKLHESLLEREKKSSDHPPGRLFYLALPPTVYPEAS